MVQRLFLILATAAALAGCSKSGSSPLGDAGAKIQDASVSDAAPSFDFTALHQEEFGGAWQTEGIVVLYRGQIVYEEYAAGWSKTMRHILYSASKTVGGALVGIAIDQGLLAKTDSVCTYVTPPPGADPTLCATTVADLLHMGSGLAWSEDYGTDPTTSNVLEMLYGNETDMGAYAASLPRVAEAGATFNYSSGDADLLAATLKGALKGQDMRAWAQSKLFGPAGLASAVFEADRSGTLVFSSSLFMTTRDFATFGQLYLDDGMSGSTRVLPQGWVQYTITPAPPVATPASRLLDAGAGPGGSYGAQMWLNAASPTATPDTFEYPQEPVDGFNAEGHWGQKLVIVPSRSLVIARVGNDRTPAFDPGPMIGAAVSAIDAQLGGDK